MKRKPPKVFSIAKLRAAELKALSEKDATIPSEPKCKEKESTAFDGMFFEKPTGMAWLIYCLTH